MVRQEKIRALIEHVIQLEYGSIMPHYEIEQIIEEKQKSDQYKSVIASAKKELLALGKMIENIHGVGYRVTNPDDYTAQSIKYATAGARAISKGAKILDKAPLKDMSQEGVQEYNAVADRMKMLNAFVSGSKVELRMLASKRKHPLLNENNGESVRNGV